MALTQHLHSDAFKAPGCWLCSQDTAGPRRGRRQTSGAQEPRAPLLSRLLIRTWPQQVTQTCFPSYENSGIPIQPFFLPLLSKGWHSLSDALPDLLDVHHPGFPPSEEPHTAMGTRDPSYGLNDPRLFPEVHSKARNTPRLSHSPFPPSSAFLPSHYSPKHPLKANGN